MALCFMIGNLSFEPTVMAREPGPSFISVEPKTGPYSRQALIRVLVLHKHIHHYLPPCPCVPL